MTAEPCSTPSSAATVRIGNDVFGLWDAVYDTALPQREQDIAQAKKLLARLGTPT